jgi:uncharacterized phage-like protein YoqJ
MSYIPLAKSDLGIILFLFDEKGSKWYQNNSFPLKTIRESTDESIWWFNGFTIGKSEFRKEDKMMIQTKVDQCSEEEPK